MKIFLIFQLLILASVSQAKLTKTESWSWTYENRRYSIGFNSDAVKFVSEYERVSISQSECSKNVINEFKLKLQNLIESKNYRVPANAPKNFTTIEMSSADFGKFLVLPGSPLGLFLIDIKYEIQSLKTKADFQCKS